MDITPNLQNIDLVIQPVDGRNTDHRIGAYIPGLDNIVGQLDLRFNLEYQSPSEEFFIELHKVWSTLFTNTNDDVFKKFKEEVISSKIIINKGYLQLLFNVMYTAAEFGFNSLMYLTYSKHGNSVFSPGSLLGLQLYLSQITIANETMKENFFKVINSIATEDIITLTKEEASIIGSDSANDEIIFEYNNFLNTTTIPDLYLRKGLHLLFMLSQSSEVESLGFVYSNLVSHFSELLYSLSGIYDQDNFSDYEFRDLMIKVVKKAYGVVPTASNYSTNNIVINSWIKPVEGTTKINSGKVKLMDTRDDRNKLKRFKPDLNFLQSISIICEALENNLHSKYSRARMGAEDHMKFLYRLQMDEFRIIEKEILQAYEGNRDVVNTLRDHYIRTNSKTLDGWIACSKFIWGHRSPEVRRNMLVRNFVNYLNTTYSYDPSKDDHENLGEILCEYLSTNQELLRDRDKGSAYITLLFNTFNQAAEYGFNTIYRLTTAVRQMSRSPFEPASLLMLSMYLSKITIEADEVKEFVNHILDNSFDPEIFNTDLIPVDHIINSPSKIFYDQDIEKFYSLFPDLAAFCESNIVRILEHWEKRGTNVSNGKLDLMDRPGFVKFHLVNNFKMLFAEICRNSKSIDLSDMNNALALDSINDEIWEKLKVTIYRLLSTLLGFSQKSNDIADISRLNNLSALAPVKGRLSYNLIIPEIAQCIGFKYLREPFHHVSKEPLRENPALVDLSNELGQILLGEDFKTMSTIDFFTKAIDQTALIQNLKLIDPDSTRSHLAFGADISILFPSLTHSEQ